jgi:hypothetical protein
MRYIQLGKFDTNHLAYEVQRALDAWLAANGGQRTLHMAVIAADHDRLNHYWELLEYASEQETMKTADLPVTKAPYRWSGLLNRGPTFRNLDVVAQAGDPEGPVEGLGPVKTAGAGSRDGGSNGA